VSKILLCGLPGSGKTTVGNQLRERGWIHFDCEARHVENPLWVEDPLEHLPDGVNVVASWGFIPHFMEAVWDIIDAGYTPVWLHGTDENRLRSLAERGENKTFLETRSRKFQKLGLHLIDPDTVLNAYKPDGSRWNVAGFIHSLYWTEHNR
jgi:hypothetical protein